MPMTKRSHSISRRSAEALTEGLGLSASLGEAAAVTIPANELLEDRRQYLRWAEIFLLMLGYFEVNIPNI